MNEFKVGDYVVCIPGKEVMGALHDLEPNRIYKIRGKYVFNTILLYGEDGKTFDISRFISLGNTTELTKLHKAIWSL